MTAFAPHLGQRLLAFCMLITLLAGCAHRAPNHTSNGPPSPVWEGRLAIHIASTPPQSFSSGFSLQGDSEQGLLTFYSPLGNTAAELRWAPGLAQWQQGREQRHYPDVSSLLLDATGANLPLAALFDWLQGRNTQVPDWRVDTSQLELGRLRAQRAASNGQAAIDVRLVLDR